MKITGLFVLAASLAVIQAGAQTPSSSTGQCKDGTYSTSASKSGACRGHQGVKDWYAAEGTAKSAQSTKPAGSSSQAAAPGSASMSGKPSAAGGNVGPMPAGASGQCKDDTYSMAATKAGACRGHQGVKQWFAETGPASSTAAMDGATKQHSRSEPPPASTGVPSPAPMSAPAARTMPASPASTPPSGHTSKNGSRVERPQAPGGGPGLVWVNTTSKVYHCQGTEFYGTTKAGKYMNEADAKSAGARPDDNKPCTR